MSQPISGVIQRPPSLMCQAHFAQCVLVSLASRPAHRLCVNAESEG